ncbi:hypothetical protein CLV84_3685 [Neolewinella xylanilytica]|uniref:Uncharacterized protein n=1 Tax=Neolewinella xylanilytica TaxID=1514080 RepID=A0A2S6I0Q9_9BACT|nr:hypothetical protein [Neolewinella xylanilytica]PPK84525.1 hypothetical protein CLV84_3685 [Neolewinella xylanilytica]
MKEQTLGGYTPAPKLQFHDLLPWTAPILLWLGIFACLLQGNTYDQRILTGAALLAVATVITFFRSEAGVLLTLPVIMAGIVGLAVFFPIQPTAGLEFGLFNLTFDLLLIFVAVIHFLTNRETFLPVRTEPTPRQKERELRRAVAQYKQQFARLDLPELEHIAEDRRFLPAAVRAARELIESFSHD